MYNSQQMQMLLVVFLFAVLKINAEQKVTRMSLNNVAQKLSKINSKQKSALLLGNKQNNKNIYKQINEDSVHLFINEDSEFPLEKKTNLLLDNQDAEINSQNKIFKRFVKGNYPKIKQNKSEKRENSKSISLKIRNCRPTQKISQYNSDFKKRPIVNNKMLKKDSLKLRRINTGNEKLKHNYRHLAVKRNICSSNGRKIPTCNQLEDLNYKNLYDMELSEYRPSNECIPKIPLNLKNEDINREPTVLFDDYPQDEELITRTLSTITPVEVITDKMLETITNDVLTTLKSPHSSTEAKILESTSQAIPSTRLQGSDLINYTQIQANSLDGRIVSFNNINIGTALNNSLTTSNGTRAGLKTTNGPAPIKKITTKDSCIELFQNVLPRNQKGGSKLEENRPLGAYTSTIYNRNQTNSNTVLDQNELGVITTSFKNVTPKPIQIDVYSNILTASQNKAIASLSMSTLIARTSQASNTLLLGSYGESTQDISGLKQKATLSNVFTEAVNKSGETQHSITNTLTTNSDAELATLSLQRQKTSTLSINQIKGQSSGTSYDSKEAHNLKLVTISQNTSLDKDKLIPLTTKILHSSINTRKQIIQAASNEIGEVFGGTKTGTSPNTTACLDVVSLLTNTILKSTMHSDDDLSQSDKRHFKATTLPSKSNNPNETTLSTEEMRSPIDNLPKAEDTTMNTETTEECLNILLSITTVNTTDSTFNVANNYLSHNKKNEKSIDLTSLSSEIRLLHTVPTYKPDESLNEAVSNIILQSESCTGDICRTSSIDMSNHNSKYTFSNLLSAETSGPAISLNESSDNGYLNKPENMTMTSSSSNSLLVQRNNTTLKLNNITLKSFANQLNKSSNRTAQSVIPFLIEPTHFSALHKAKSYKDQSQKNGSSNNCQSLFDRAFPNCTEEKGSLVRKRLQIRDLET